MPAHKIKPSGTRHRSRGKPRGAAGAAEVVSRTAARSPPPTRAGGQDDGSYTNSLKLYYILSYLILSYNILYYTIVYYIILYYIIVYCIVLYYIIL